LIEKQKTGEITDVEAAEMAKKYFEWLDPTVELVAPFERAIQLKTIEIENEAMGMSEMSKAELMAEAAKYWKLLNVGVKENITSQEEADVFMDFGGPAARGALAFLAATMGVRAIGHATPAVDLRVTAAEVKVVQQNDTVEMPAIVVVGEAPSSEVEMGKQALQSKREYAQHYTADKEQFAEQEVNRLLDNIVDQMIAMAKKFDVSPMAVDFAGEQLVEFTASFDGDEVRNKSLCDSMEAEMGPKIKKAMEERGFDTSNLKFRSVGERIRVPDGTGGMENIKQDEAERRLVKLLNVGSVDDVYKLIKVYNKTPGKLTQEQKQQLDLYVGNNRVPTISYTLKVNISKHEGKSTLPETPEPKTEVNVNVDIEDTNTKQSRLVELVAEERRYVQPIFEDNYVVQMYDPENDDVLPPGEKIKYSCVSGQCLLDVKGNFKTLEECKQNCEIPPPPPPPLPPGENIKYSCVNGKCIPGPSGEYSTYEQCMQYCKVTPPPPPPDGESGYAGQKGPNIQRMHREVKRDDELSDVGVGKYEKDTGRRQVELDTSGDDVQESVRSERTTTAESLDEEKMDKRKKLRSQAKQRRAERGFKKRKRNSDQEYYSSDETEI